MDFPSAVPLVANNFSLCDSIIKTEGLMSGILFGQLAAIYLSFIDQVLFFLAVIFNHLYLEHKGEERTEIYSSFPVNTRLFHIGEA